MIGMLFVVATPIGNLEDMTLRAIRVLREADIIAAEDTRRTARLLSHYSIDTSSTSFHAHNLKSKLPGLVARLERGDKVALVTDAGTPAISDPGLELVQACIARGIPVDPIPGASAPLTVAVVSGFPLSPWTVLGFPPVRSHGRKAWLSELNRIPHTVSFFEAPHRVRATLQDAVEIVGTRPIVIGRELTKAHQEFLRGTAKTLLEKLESPRGEFTVVVGPLPETSKYPDVAPDSEIVDVFWQMAKGSTLSRRELVSAIAKKYSMSAKSVYSAVEKSKLVE